MDFTLLHNILKDINFSLSIPSLIIFLGAAVILTIKLRFMQFRAFPYFISLIRHGVKQEKKENFAMISSLQALFSAMATTIGMGNIVGPSIAISIGGPGALFWLIVYIFFASAIKLTEVTFSVHTRTIAETGNIIGGPTQYLRLFSPKIATLYAFLTIFLFTGWSGLQVNTLASIWAQEGVPHWLTGLLAATVLLSVVLGGVKRIGYFASRIVPLKFTLYVLFALFILLKDIPALIVAVKLVFNSIFTPTSAVGGFLGVTVFMSLKEGIYKGIFITESGIGTSSISHALANVKHPIDQGILAMFSSIADIFLCSLSGLIALVTGVWTSGKLNNTLTYEAFKLHSTFFGKYVLVVSVFLFVITALIGNTYNGSQSFASITKYRFVRFYYLIAAGVAFAGALCNVPLLWQFMDIILVVVAIPHLLALLYISFKHSNVTKF